QALDAPLDLLAAGERRLLVGLNGVDVGGDGGKRQRDAGHARVVAERGEQPLHAAAIALLDHVVQPLAPFPLVEGFELSVVFRYGISHCLLAGGGPSSTNLVGLQSAYCRTEKHPTENDVTCRPRHRPCGGSLDRRRRRT